MDCIRATEVQPTCPKNVLLAIQQPQNETRPPSSWLTTRLLSQSLELILKTAPDESPSKVRGFNVS